MRAAFAVFLAVIPLAAQDGANVLAVTAGSADYLLGAGGTLAGLALDGHNVYIAQFGNDEKDSAALSPAATRRANIDEGKQAAEFLGFRDAIYLAHKSGETAYVSSTEMREQLFALIRHLRPRKLFIPDPYVHYQADQDLYWVGRMAEEAWGYSGGSTFSPDLTRMGLKPYSAPEVYFYAVGRPYPEGEGGEGNARFIGVDIGATVLAKKAAIGMLNTRNRALALEARARLGNAFQPLDERGPRGFAESFVEDLARAVGARHGFRYGEEFNYVGPGEPLPPHVMERAVPK
ncbi:MAG: PIG-L family deacetylase [Bryobacteraceae bacterium]|nr:PIG-L family deacetylase [Bryobacteraceae bacterium]